MKKWKFSPANLSTFTVSHTVISDNGPQIPQYDSVEIKQFASTYGFNHVTSSPYYPQSNGLAERMVKSIKSLIGETSDMYLTLLSYRATSLPWYRLNPAELLMGRRLCSDVPQVSSLFIPVLPHPQGFEEKDGNISNSRKNNNYDGHHRMRPLTPMPNDTDVWVNVHGRGLPSDTDMWVNIQGRDVQYFWVLTISRLSDFALKRNFRDKDFKVLLVTNNAPLNY